MHNRHKIWILMGFLMLSACAKRMDTAEHSDVPVVESTMASAETLDLNPAQVAQQTPPPIPTAIPIPATLMPAQTTTFGIQTGVPSAFLQALEAIVAVEPDFYWRSGPRGQADWELAFASGGIPAGEWVVALAAPFPTLEDNVSMAELRERWVSAEPTLTTDNETAAALTHLLGPPGSGLLLLPPEQIADRLWQRDGVWGLLPFDQLQPNLKALKVEGVSPFYDVGDVYYPLSLPLVFVPLGEGAANSFDTLKQAWGDAHTNRDPQKITHIAMTGVTALTRATAYKMEINGVNYPAEAVAEWLQSADFTHISNEVSFNADCPPPNFNGMTFCSANAYFDLFTYIGADIIELTGNHLNDFGSNYLETSIATYDAAGMLTFGGGLNSADAIQPLLIEHNGNHIAFVGCNPVGPPGDWATAERAGSRPCGDDMSAQISQLAADGYLVIATMQYWEEYSYYATPTQIRDFNAFAEAGAVVVSGSQGHHAQGFALPDNAFIHYGLGNLFFDQMQMLGTRQTFIDNLIFYDGRLLGVDLSTYLIEDYARPREMDSAERDSLLRSVFTASGWR